MANEKRLIDANALIKAHRRVCSMDMKYNLDLAPTVDAVEVVRCAECKHWKKFQSSLIGEVMCCTGQGSVLIQKGATDFCSSGERGSDGATQI